MSSVCHNIKTEYEALKALKEKFVFACDDAKASVGSFDALSKHELNKIKLLKRELEQARNAIDQHIETKAAKTWTRIYETIMTAIAKDEPFEGMTVQELIHQERFQKTFIRGIESLVNMAQTQLESARLAVTALHAAVESKLVNEDAVLNIKKLMEEDLLLKSRFVKCITIYSQNGRFNSDNASQAIIGLHTARELDLLSEKETDSLQLLVMQPEFKQTLVGGMNDNADRGRTNLGNAWQVTVALHAALGLNLLEKNDIEKIQEYVENEDFQKKFVEDIVLDAQGGQFDRSNAVNVVRAINSIKGIIELSQRRKKK